MDKEVGNRIIQNQSQATDKLKASSKKDWKNTAGGKMCDLINCNGKTCRQLKSLG